MILRYLLDGVEGCKIGIAYNLRTGQMIIGSRRVSNLEAMHSILVDFFGIQHIPLPKKYGGNRIRIELRVSYRRWSRGLKDMLFYQIGISPVKSFGRLMR